MARLWGILRSNQSEGRKQVESAYICVKNGRDEQAADNDPVTPRTNRIHSGGDPAQSDSTGTTTRGIHFTYTYRPMTQQNSSLSLMGVIFTGCRCTFPLCTAVEVPVLVCSELLLCCFVQVQVTSSQKKRCSPAFFIIIIILIITTILGTFPLPPTHITSLPSQAPKKKETDKPQSPAFPPHPSPHRHRRHLIHPLIYSFIHPGSSRLLSASLASLLVAN